MSTHIDVRAVKSANDIGRGTSVEELDHELDDILLTSGNGFEGLDITERLEDVLEPVGDRATIHLRVTSVKEDGSGDESLEVRDTVRAMLSELGSKLLGSHRMQTPFGVELFNLFPRGLGLARVVETNVDDTTRSQLVEDGSTKGAELATLEKKS